MIIQVGRGLPHYSISTQGSILTAADKRWTGLFKQFNAGTWKSNDTPSRTNPCTTHAARETLWMVLCLERHLGKTAALQRIPTRTCTWQLCSDCRLQEYL
jgi:hypothetical protein